eukprot:ctg_3360.g497
MRIFATLRNPEESRRWGHGLLYEVVGLDSSGGWEHGAGAGGRGVRDRTTADGMAIRGARVWHAHRDGVAPGAAKSVAERGGRDARLAATFWRGLAGEVGSCVGDALVQAVALIVLDGDGSGDSIVDDVENPPYIHPAVIAALRQTYNSVRHFLTNLPSLDRAIDAGQVRTHRAVFASELDALHMVDEEGAPAAVPVSARHTITELLAVPTSLAAPQTRRGYLIIALAPMRGMDAVPSSVYFRESRKRPDG